MFEYVPDHGSHFSAGNKILNVYALCDLHKYAVNQNTDKNMPWTRIRNKIESRMKQNDADVISKTLHGKQCNCARGAIQHAHLLCARTKKKF